MQLPQDAYLIGYADDIAAMIVDIQRRTRVTTCSQTEKYKGMETPLQNQQRRHLTIEMESDNTILQVPNPSLFKQKLNETKRGRYS